MYPIDIESILRRIDNPSRNLNSRSDFRRPLELRVGSSSSAFRATLRFLHGEVCPSETFRGLDLGADLLEQTISSTGESALCAAGPGKHLEKTGEVYSCLRSSEIERPTTLRSCH